jgi:hypothetical protein
MHQNVSAGTAPNRIQEEIDHCELFSHIGSWYFLFGDRRCSARKSGANF